MPKVVCSVGGNSVFAVTKGVTTEIRGTIDFQRCHTSHPLAEASGDVDEPLEWEEMETVAATALVAVGDDGSS